MNLQPQLDDLKNLPHQKPESAVVADDGNALREMNLNLDVSEKAQTKQKVNLYTSVIVAFNSSRQIRVFMIHLFPYFFMLFESAQKELQAMWFYIHYDDINAAIVGLFINHIVLLLVYYIIVASMLLSYTESITTESYSDTEVPLSQLVAFSYIIPLVFFVVHRIAVANKYALFSSDEYSQFIKEEDPKAIRENIRRVNLFGNEKGLDDELLTFEILSAAARSSVSPKRTFFHITDPLQNYESFHNFRHWQGFLLGKPTVDELDHRIHPLLSNVIEVVEFEQKGNAERFASKAVDAFLDQGDKKDYSQSMDNETKNRTVKEFTNRTGKIFLAKGKEAADAVGSKLKEAEPGVQRFKLLGKKALAAERAIKTAKRSVGRRYYRVSVDDVARALHRWTERVPDTTTNILKKLVRVSVLVVTFLQIYPLLLRSEAPEKKSCVHAVVNTLLAAEMIVVANFMPSNLNFLTVQTSDLQRRLTYARLLNQMIRGNDLDMDLTLAYSGFSPSQRVVVPDYIDIVKDEQDRPIYLFKTARNPNITRIPRISISSGSSKMTRNNVITWSFLRDMGRKFNPRIKWRLDAYVALNFFSVAFVILTIIFSMYTQLSECQVAAAQFADCEILPYYRLSYYSPVVLQTVVVAFTCTLVLMVNIFVSTHVNTEYNQHSKILVDRYMKNESERCHSHEQLNDLKKMKSEDGNEEKIAVLKQISTELADLSDAINTVIMTSEASDKANPLRICGAEASFGLFTIIGGYFSVIVTAFSALVSISSEFEAFTSLYLNSKFERSPIFQ